MSGGQSIVSGVSRSTFLPSLSGNLSLVISSSLLLHRLEEFHTVLFDSGSGVMQRGCFTVPQDQRNFSQIQRGGDATKASFHFGRFPVLFFMCEQIIAGKVTAFQGARVGLQKHCLPPSIKNSCGKWNRNNFYQDIMR